MEKKKVLICGIRDYGNRFESHYFITKDEGEEKFCEGLVSGEGGAKEILSSIDIDEIIAIGSSNQCLAGKEDGFVSASNHKMKLNEGIDLLVSDTDRFSDFDFFRYRLTQFVEGVNIDMADFIGKVEEKRQNEILDHIKSIVGEDLSGAFITYVHDEEIRNRIRELYKSLTIEEISWIKRYLYSALEKQYKLSAKGNNSGIPISFIPITDNRDHKVLNRFQNLITELLTGEEKEVELYIDLHGFSLEDSFVCIHALYALHEDPNSSIRIKNIVDENMILSGELHEISLSSGRYRVQKLMSGIYAFIQNGKTDILREYWAESKERNQGLKNEYIDRLFLAMSYVDSGISLCSMGELEKGIYGLRKLFANHEIHYNVEDEGEALLMTLRESIIRDYGALVENSGEKIDSLELIKWAYRKKFYQQVITMIESRMPVEMVNRGILYPAENDAEKLAYLKAMNYHYWDALQKDRYIFRDLEHYFIKTYGRFAVNYKDRSTDKTTEYTTCRVEQVFRGTADRGLLPAHSLIKDKALLTEILDRYYRVSNVRNTINHALGGQNDSEEALLRESKLWNDVGTMIGEFIDCYERVLDSIGEQEFTQIKISQDEFKNYVYNHGPRCDPEFRNAAGYVSYRNRNQRKGSNDRYRRKSYRGNRQRDDRGNRNHASTSAQPNVNIDISVSQKKGISGFFQKLFGGHLNKKKQQENGAAESGNTLEIQNSSGNNQQESSQGNINIRINIE